MFDTQLHETIARDIASEYENKVAKSNPFYTRTPFDKLPEDCQLEHAGIARAAMAGGTYNGKSLPTWVMDIVTRRVLEANK